MIKRKFPKEDLQNLAKGNCKNYRIIENSIMEVDYWFIHWKQIFEFEDKFYKTTYTQEICRNKEPYINEPKFIECIEVSPVEKMVTVYESTKENIMCEKECTCEQLDSFSRLFTEMMKEPIKFVDMDCPIHGSQHKPKKPRKVKDKAVRKTA